MSFDFSYPKITGTTEAEKIEQIRSYLYQLADILKWALNSVENGASTKSGASLDDAVAAQATFNAVKALIMNSNDIVDAYYYKINKKFADSYVSKKAYEEYTEKNDQSVKNIENYFPEGKLSIDDAVIAKTLNIGSYLLDASKKLDFVTECGEVAGWKYQKYLSGMVIAYGSVTKIVKCNLHDGSWFYASADVELPELFNNISNISSSVISPNGMRGVAIGSVDHEMISAAVYSASEDTSDVSVRLDFTLVGT
jgi:hypothetical protein